mmetsp:Transcript_21595/g.43787  ORF Transcript_21595/g.43787 Transcript_21595/m.43787 type:complete len:290 (+) Transcript_21595:690-1559(+)
MMRLTQSIWMAVRGLSVSTAEPRHATKMAVMLTVSWNCKNRQMLSYTHRPHSTALTMETKLSSMMITSDAFFATSVPWMPMAKPTSAFLRAGASLVPSPVTATVCFLLAAWSPETRWCLSSGVERPITSSFSQILSNSAWSSLPVFATVSRNVLPSHTLPGSASPSMMPHFFAIAAAVFMLSPVTMRTTMPARRHALMASGTSLRTGSSIPTSPIMVSFCSASLTSSIAVSTLRTARQMVRRASSAKRLMMSIVSCLALASKGCTEPSSTYRSVHRSTTISAAPLQKIL